MFVPFPKPLVMTVRVVVMFATSMLSLLYTMVMRLLMKFLQKTTDSLLTYINPGEYNISFSVK